MLSREEVQHIALLARVGLEADEVEKFRKDISDVLDWMKMLQEVNTEKIKPIGHITGMKNEAMKDVIISPLPAEKEQVIKNFPATKDGFNKVRSVF